MARLEAADMTLPLPQSTSVQLGKVAYWIRPRIEATLTISGISPCSHLPVVIINVGDSNFNDEDTADALDRFTMTDDVYQPLFAKRGLIVKQCPNEHKKFQSTIVGVEYNLHEAPKMELKYCSGSGPSLIPEGPYFGQVRDSTIILHQAWRLYEDDLDTLVTSIVPAAEEGEQEMLHFQPLPVSAYSGLHHSVAVPSRLYTNPSSEKPFNGLRISVKDNMHLAGIITTLGSRSYTKLEGVQRRSSEYLEDLVNKGAVIVGKTKLSAYAGSEVPPNQAIDYLPPWNPRGDGYQGPSGSSSGAGASVAGYPWLDAALCTDTTGSARMPASSHGVWGLRISWYRVSIRGVVPSVPPFDTWAVLARHPNIIQALISSSHTRSMTGASDDTIPARSFGRPNRIIYPTDWYPLPNAEQQSMTEIFLADLESYLELSHTKLSLREEWKKTAPEDLRSKSLDEFLDKSVHWVNGYDGYHTFDTFREKYREQYSAEPYASPAHRNRWAHGAKITKQQRDQAYNELSIFRTWVREKIFLEDEHGLSRTIMLAPVGRPGANYRDVEKLPPNSGPGYDNGYDEDFFGSAVQLPQVVIPIGQNPYQSRVSEQKEYAPIMTTLIASNGLDEMLVDIGAQALEKAGWPVDVQTGRFMFAPADNLRHTKPERETLV